MSTSRHLDVEEEVIALSYAIRLILSHQDKGVIIERALEALADFGRAERVGLFLLLDDHKTLIAAGGVSGGVLNRTSMIMEIEDGPSRHVLETKRIGSFNLGEFNHLPWPVYGQGLEGRRCLCAPLIASDNKPIGLVTFDQPADYDPSPAMTQPLIVLLTVVAISLENARLFEQAVIDGLTEVYVRRYFTLRLAEEKARLERYGGRLALALVDVDQFKAVNDNFGHQWGDIALKKAAQAMTRVCRRHLDVVCRFGGDEFVIIMPETDRKGAWETAERIRSRIEGLDFEHPGNELKMTVSIGLAICDNEAGQETPDLLAQADEALYRAKNQSRNKVMVAGD